MSLPRCGECGSADTGSSPTGDWCNDCGGSWPGCICDVCGRKSIKNIHRTRLTEPATCPASEDYYDRNRQEHRMRVPLPRPSAPGEHWHLVSDDSYFTTVGIYVERVEAAWVFGRFGEIVPLSPPTGWHWEKSPA